MASLRNLKIRTSVLKRDYYNVPLIMRRTSTYWTQEEIIKLVDGYNGGLTKERLATKVGRSETACQAKISQLKREQEAIEATLSGKK